MQVTSSGASAPLAPFIYQESIPAPKWLAGMILAGMAFVGFMIGLEATRNSLEGGERLLFFVFMALALVVQGVVALNFFVLKVTVTPDSVEFAYGIFKRRLRWSQVTGYSVQRYDWMQYGGWGLRFGLRGRRAWSVPGVPEGLSFQVEEKGKRREYFVSSRRPADFAGAVARASSRPQV